MKRIISALLVMVSMAFGSQVILNEGFEGSQFPPQGWEIYWDGGGVSRVYDGGSWRSLVYANGELHGASFYYEYIQVNKGDRLSVDFYAKCVENNCGYMVGWYLYIIDNNPNNFIHNHIPENNQYKKFEGTLLADLDSTATIGFFADGGFGDLGKVYIDNIKLTKGNPNDVGIYPSSLGKIKVLYR